jgi:hypothetical protein
MSLNNPLEAAKAELDLLLIQEAEIKNKIDAVRIAIKALEPAYNRPGPVPWPPSSYAVHLAELLGNPPTNVAGLLGGLGGDGLTFRIRAALRAQPKEYFTPVEVRDLVEASGFDLAGRSNVMAEVHQILKRIGADPQFVSKTHEDGTIAYGFDPSKPKRLHRYRRAVSLK